MFKAIRCQSGSRAFGFRLRSELSFFKSSIGIHKLKSNAIFQFSLKNLCGNFVLQMHSDVNCYKMYNVHTEFPRNLKLHNIQQIGDTNSDTDSDNNSGPNSDAIFPICTSLYKYRTRIYPKYFLVFPQKTSPTKEN